MNRRGFLKFFGGGLVATATMAEAGAFAEFMDWIRRAPAWSFPSPRYGDVTFDQINAVTLEYIRQPETYFWMPMDTPFKFKMVKGFYTGGNIIQEPFTYEKVAS